MYSSISPPPQLSPCFIPQAFSFGFNNDMNFTSSMPMFHHYFTTPLISPTRRSTTSHKLMSSPKSTPIKIHQPNDQLINEPRRKQSSQKKDRNCKIVTAQGLRDRRVRLSVDIARRFFDLQDLLGFDTASKTLDWLLTKSRTAIKELQTNPVVVVEENAKQCEAYVTFTGADEDSNKNKSTFCTKKRRVESGHQVEIKEERFAQNCCVKSFDNNFGKEVRAKARAGAPHDSEPFGLLQPIKSCKTCESELFCFCLLNGIAESEETFGNSGIITKKLKPSTVTSDNLEMTSCNTLFCSNNMTNSSGDLQEIFGGIQQ